MLNCDVPIFLNMVIYFLIFKDKYVETNHEKIRQILINQTDMFGLI